jgi:hypothetical protein
MSETKQNFQVKTIPQKGWANSNEDQQDEKSFK